MKYQVSTPVKVGKPGRIIKPGGPVSLTEQELRDAKDYLVDADDSPAPARATEKGSSGKGDDPGPKGSGEPLDLNAATKDQLIDIGLSDKAAGAVIGYRKKLAKNGQRFESIDELTAVHGLGDKALEKVSDRLTVSEA